MEAKKQEQDQAREQITREEAWAIFDKEIRALLGMSGEAFASTYDTGRCADPDDDPAVMYLVLLRQLAA